MIVILDSAQILHVASNTLLNGRLNDAREMIRSAYPFSPQPAQLRKYSEIQKTRIFARDGFIDRYCGKRLVFIGMLRLFSFLMPIEFPYHPNWKIDSCHPAYWELAPTLDHIVPIARGGVDQSDNWITCSMISNAAKANWTLEELGWKVLPPGDLVKWDGLINNFIALVESGSSLARQESIKEYYRVIKDVLLRAG